MAFLKSYVVTSGISPDEIKEEVIKRLAAAEEMNENGELGFAMTFDYTNKKLYMIFSDKMVAQDEKMEENMVEVESNSGGLLNDQIDRINRTLKILVDADGTVIGNKTPIKGSTQEAPAEEGQESGVVDFSELNAKVVLLQEKVLVLESKLNSYLKKADILALIRNEIAGKPELNENIPAGPEAPKPEQGSPVVPEVQDTSKFYVGTMSVPAGNQDYDFTNDIQNNLAEKEEFDYATYVDKGVALNVTKQPTDEFVWYAFEDGKENVEINTDSGFNPDNVVEMATNIATITHDFGSGSKTYKVLVTASAKTGALDPVYIKTK